MHHLASLGWCSTFRSTMCKSNMFLERTFLSLTPCQESAHVMHDEAIQGLDVSVHEVYLQLNHANEGAPDKRGNWQRYNLVSPAWNHYAWMAWKEIELPCFSSCILELSQWAYHSRCPDPERQVYQPDALKQLHYAHQGSEKCKLRAKGSVCTHHVSVTRSWMSRNPCCLICCRSHGIHLALIHFTATSILLEHFLVIDYYSSFLW